MVFPWFLPPIGISAERRPSIPTDFAAGFLPHGCSAADGSQKIQDGPMMFSPLFSGCPN